LLNVLSQIAGIKTTMKKNEAVNKCTERSEEMNTEIGKKQKT